MSLSGERRSSQKRFQKCPESTYHSWNIVHFKDNIKQSASEQWGIEHHFDQLSSSWPSLKAQRHPFWWNEIGPVAWGNKRGVQNDHFLMAKSIYEGGRFLIFKIVFVKSAYIFTQKAINKVYKLIWSTAKSGPFLTALAILHCGEFFLKIIIFCHIRHLYQGKKFENILDNSACWWTS